MYAVWGNTKRTRRIKNENTTNTIDTIGREVPKRAIDDIEVEVTSEVTEVMKVIKEI
jgi:hypothetical protein